MLIPKLLEWEDFGHKWLTCLCYARNIFRCLQKEDRPEDEDEVSYFTKLVFWSQSYSTFGFLDCRYAVASLERLHESMLPSKKRLGRREHGATGATGAMRYEFLLPRSLQQGFYCSNLKEFRPKSPQRVVQVLVTWWLFLTAHCRLCDYYVQDGPEEFFDHDIWYWVIIIKRVNLGLLDLLLPCLSPGGWRSPAGNRTAHLRTAGRNTPCCLAQVDSMCNYETSQRDLFGVHRAPRTFIIFAPSQVGAVFCFKSLLSLSRGKRCSGSYIFQWSITSFPLGLASVQDLFRPFPVCSLAEKHKLGQPDAGRGRTKGGEAEKWDTP